MLLYYVLLHACKKFTSPAEGYNRYHTFRQSQPGVPVLQTWENFTIRQQDELKCPAGACDCCGDSTHVAEKPATTEDGTVLHKKQSVLDRNFMVPRKASASDGYLTAMFTFIVISIIRYFKFYLSAQGRTVTFGMEIDCPK